MPKAEKLDLHKQHKGEYITPKTPKLVEVGPAKYLAINGRGEPGGKDFQAKVQAMYGCAFTIKMTSKAGGRDYKVCHLEGLWWAEGQRENFLESARDQWCWKLLIRIPDFIGPDHLSSAVETLLKKGKSPEVAQVALESIEEGLCVQMLHVGAYETEGESIAAMKRFAGENALKFHALHHEIYLSDPRRIPPRAIANHPPSAGASRLTPILEFNPNTRAGGFLSSRELHPGLF